MLLSWLAPDWNGKNPHGTKPFVSATSADGVRWAKPPLAGAVLPGTNVVRDVEHYDTSVVWLDHAERNASRRWKMSEAACTYCSHSYGLLSSATGVRWEVGVERTGYVP